MNKSLARTSVRVGMMAAGLVLLAGGPAHAGGDATTSDNYGAGNGNQLLGTIQVPISLCGNAIAVLGVANAGCHGNSTAVVHNGHGDDWSTHDNYGLLNGNQAGIDVQAPISVCGNAIGIFGVANAGCQGDATAWNGR